MHEKRLDQIGICLIIAVQFTLCDWCMAMWVGLRTGAGMGGGGGGLELTT